MFGIVSQKDFLAQCYMVADVLVVVGQYIWQILALVGINMPDFRGACFTVYTAIGGT